MRYYNCADGSSSSNANGKEQMGLNVREDTRKGVYVENLIEEGVTGADAAGSILQRGYRNRYVCMHANTVHYTCKLCIIFHCSSGLSEAFYTASFLSA
jgi:hypothetical protein